MNAPDAHPPDDWSIEKSAELYQKIKKADAFGITLALRLGQLAENHHAPFLGQWLHKFRAIAGHGGQVERHLFQWRLPGVKTREFEQ